jgi:hypothetical protein
MPIVKCTVNGKGSKNKAEVQAKAIRAIKSYKSKRR